MADQTSFFNSQISIYPRCVDGRAAEVFVSWQNEGWRVEKSGVDAKQDNGPQFLGASLVFVRALEVVANIDRDKAFDLTERASKSVSLELQIHQDDEHGHFNISEMSDEQLVNYVADHHVGCGFAKYAWGDEGVEVIKEAKKRHFRVQILVGAHQEKGAYLNYVQADTFDTAAAVADNNSAFNTDVLVARDVFEALEELIDQPGFAKKAEEWMVETYKDVVVALKGVESKDQVIERK